MGAQNLSSSLHGEIGNKLKKGKIIKSDKLTFIGSRWVFFFFLLRGNPKVENNLNNIKHQLECMLLNNLKQ